MKVGAFYEVTAELKGVHWRDSFAHGTRIGYPPWIWLDYNISLTFWPRWRTPIGDHKSLTVKYTSEWEKVPSLKRICIRLFYVSAKIITTKQNLLPYKPGRVRLNQRICSGVFLSRTHPFVSMAIRERRQLLLLQPLCRRPPKGGRRRKQRKICKCAKFFNNYLKAWVRYYWFTI